MMVCILALDDVWIFFWSSRNFGDKNSLIFGEELFFGLLLNSGTKTFQLSMKIFFFFFGLHLICLHKKNFGRASSSPMLKIRRNWGKIANYFPQPMLNINRHHCSHSVNPLFARTQSRTYNRYGNDQSNFIAGLSHHQNPVLKPWAFKARGCHQ